MTELVRSSSAPPSVGMNLLEQCKLVAGTAMIPEYLRGKPDAVVALALKGRELGLGLMTSLDSLNYIKGKVTMSAQLMVAVAKKRVKGADIVVVESTPDTCTIIARREGCEDLTVTKTLAELSSRGLTSNPTWKKYPENMLRWRAITDACRIQFADVLTGVYTPDEMGADVDEEGEVVTAAEFTVVDYTEKIGDIWAKLIGAGVDTADVTKASKQLYAHYEEDEEKIYKSLTNGLRKHLTNDRKEYFGSILLWWTEMICKEVSLGAFEEYMETVDKEVQEKEEL